MTLPDRLRLPLRFAPEALAADARAFGAERWERHFNTGVYEGDWSGIALRSTGGAVSLYSDPAAGAGGFRDTPALDEAPALRAALAAFAAPLTSARLLRLGAGARIREHRDYNIGPDFGEVRVHVPIVTGPGVEFLLGGRPLHMRPGEAWYVDVTQPHQVWNPGPDARIHLVVDCVLDDGLRALLARAAAQPASA
ncbi:MAG TPA: aspartyl/asparaginyl beta-hydroxylase domain-containing protein [Candidatus Sulfotelmatobacter sp.]|nr:aspartyl/asparaginyl beta-hydroxylase domain-containing protein [Candidatus Sulfotelmatobacter sp.]